MLVDYVRVYQVEGQSIVIAEPTEQASSSGGGALSAVTAVSVLIVLGVLFSLCLVSHRSYRYMGMITSGDVFSFLLNSRI